MNELMKRVHETELEIMDVIHDICTKNNLKYSIFYGTLLGAIRHGGFIPWDDDIDIAMPRSDYDKLIEIWDMQAPSQYLLQRYESEDDYTNNFAKIRKDHTAFVENEDEKTKKFHKGIFVDIFPIDRVASSKVGRKVQYFMAAVNLLYARGYTSGQKGAMGLLEVFLLSTKRKNYKKRYRKSENLVKRWNGQTDNQCFSICTINACHCYFPASLFEHIQLIPFEDRRYMAVDHPEEILTLCYGDYMQLPPVEERIWGHHPLVIDFERNYEEIVQ